MEEGRFDGIARELLQAAAVGPMDLRFAVRTAGGAKWSGGLSSSGQGTAVNHAVARQNARVAMQESVQARAIIERKSTIVADGGLRLELNPVAEVLGISREAAVAKGKEISQRFHLWAKDKRQHRGGLYNFYQSQGLWQLFNNRDNDQFVRLYYEDKDPTLQNPLQFEFLDPDQVRADAYTATIYNRSTGNYTSTYGFQGMIDGIIRDDRGRETGYRVWIREPDGTFKERTINKYYPGGRLAMIHGFKPEYAGQGRGYTKLAHAIQEFENVTDFSAATIKKAINQSNLVAFVEPSKEEDASNPLEGMLSNLGAGPAAQLFGQEPQAIPNVPVTPDSQPGLDAFYRVPEATVDTPGSLFLANLTKGSTIKFPQNSAPGDSFDRFVDAFTQYVSASTNTPLEIVLMKFGQNYSASRATLLLFWAICYQEREDMATDYCNHMVEMWLSGEIAAGRISCPGWSDPRMRAAWLNASWLGSGPPDIDPQKSSKARQNNIEIGVTNVEREARDFNGSCAADNIAINNKVFAEYEPMPWNESGNPPPGVAPAPAPAATGKAMAAFLDEMRMIIREEMENA